MVLTTLGIAGCGDTSHAPKLSIVKGTVIYRQKPLANAQVLFTPQSGPMAFGETDAEGQFSLNTGGKNGAILGSHQVTISAYEPFKTPAKENENEVQPSVSRIPQKYSNLRQSGLTADIKPGEINKFSFELQ